MATITTKETRAFNWANPGTLKVGDEIVETLKDGREVVFVVVDDGVIGLKNLLGYHCMNEDWTNKGGWLACFNGTDLDMVLEKFDAAVRDLTTYQKR